MIQTPPSQRSQSDLGFYITLAVLWVVPGLIFALAATLAGGAPHTHVVEWPYVAIRSLVHSRGGILPWQWVGATTVRSSIVFWVVVVFVTVPLLAGLLFGLVVLRGGLPAFFPFLSQPVLRSRWASVRGLGRAGLLTAGPDGRRLVLGQHRDHWVALREGTSVIALGAPGSGKSAGLCIPAIGEWAGAVVAVSDRTDLIETTAGLRQHRGRVDVLDIPGGSGLATCSWSASAVHLTFDEAMALVASVLDSRDPAPDDSTRQVVTCALYAAANRGVGVGGAVEWLDDVSGDTLVRSLLQIPDRDARAISWATRFSELGAAERAASFSAARQLLRAHFEQATPGTGLPAFQPTQFLAGAADTLYVLAPRGAPAGPNAVESLLGMLVAELEQRLRRRSLLLVLDGCAAVGSMPGLSEHLTTRGGPLTVLAAVGDVDECGGQAAWEVSALAERARAVLLLGGGGDASPADLMHRLVRRQLVPRRRGIARARTDESRPDLLPPDAARHLGHGRALLVHERMAPAVLWMRNCYEDADLQQRLREYPFVRGVTRIDQAS
jgi:type IV secretory system conjugative DNA transfer VirD4/TraG family protein